MTINDICICFKIMMSVLQANFLCETVILLFFLSRWFVSFLITSPVPSPVLSSVPFQESPIQCWVQVPLSDFVSVCAVFSFSRWILSHTIQYQARAWTSVASHAVQIFFIFAVTRYTHIAGRTVQAFQSLLSIRCYIGVVVSFVADEMSASNQMSLGMLHSRC